MQNENKSDEDFRVVGIGASAGGLDALSELLSHLSEKNNMAYIVAQHLNPDRESMLAEILARKTKLYVKNAENGEDLKSNIIYVTPENKNIEINEKKQIVLTDIDKYSAIVKPSINKFFISLANHIKEKAIGVILSGSESDGAEGMKMINAENGITIVQDPQTAKFDSMPKAAMNACTIDIVTTPTNIAEELSALSLFPREMILDKYMSTKPIDEISVIFDLLYKYKRVDFSLYKPTTVGRRIERRMAALKIKSLDEYINILQDDEKEVELLYNDILIGVSDFFRDKKAFDALEKVLITYIENNLVNNELRIWVAGTSTGEEAYSIVIILKEIMQKYNLSIRIQLFATDIDENSLKIARKGIYNKNTMLDVDPSLLKKYFTCNEKEFEVKKEIRENIIFSFHNLIADPPFKDMDLIVCRNVLIYMNNDAQKYIMPTFHYALKDNGILFLGKSENATHFEDLFAPIDKNHKIFKHITSVKNDLTLGRLKYPSYQKLESFEKKAKVNSKTPLQDLIVSEAVKLLLPNIIVANEQMEVIYKKGELDYLNIPDGYLSYNLYKMIDPRFSIDLRSAINSAKKSGKTSSTSLISFTKNSTDVYFIKIYVVPIFESQSPVYICYFHSINASDLPSFCADNINNSLNDQVLKLELQRTKEHMQKLIEELEGNNEELQSLNEELQSSNEELQSTNEELETSNEELQSTNEELQTAYSELNSMYSTNNEIKENLTLLNNRYETLLEQINDGLVVSDKKGNFIKANRAMEVIIGLRRDDLLDKSWQKIGLDYDMKSHNKRYKELLSNKKTKPYIVKIIASNGIEKILNVQDYLIDGNKDEVQIWSFAADITKEIRAKTELEFSEKKYKLTFEEANIGIAHLSLEGKWISVNEKLCEFLGYSEEEMYKMSFQDITYKDDLNKDFYLYQELLSGKRDEYKIEKRYINKYGNTVWANVSVAIVRNTQDMPQFFISIVEDINSKKETLQKLEQAQVVFNSTQEAIIVTDKFANFVSVNKAFENISGYSEDEIVGKSASILKSGEHPKEFYSNMWRSLQQRGFWSGEIINRNKNGEIYPTFLNINAVRDSNNNIIQYIGVSADITLLKQSQYELHYLANHDTLTHLPNRTLFTDRAEHAIEQAKRNKNSFAVLFVDLDRFKVVNDGLGHHFGDKVLVEVSKRFAHTLRGEDTIARLGGDEFVVLVPELETPLSSEIIAQNIINAISKPMDIEGHSIKIGSSIGISIYPNDAITPEELIRQADIAMYEAKEAGRGTYRFASNELSTSAFEKVTLENAIREGLSKKEFEIYFQPVIDINSNELSHVEALIRWNHPQLGMVLPGKFIPIAEESNLITTIAEYVIYEVIDIQKILKDKYGSICKVAINFSSRDIESNELFHKFDVYVHKKRVDASSIIIELTESKLLPRSNRDIDLFDRYNKLGVQFAVDDFGTGYSNLSYLSNLPLSTLKIDQSFVKKIGKDKKSEEIVKATIAIAQALGYKTIAEGIETKKQLDFLKENGCNYGQGFYISVPLPFKKLESHIIEKIPFI